MQWSAHGVVAAMVWGLAHPLGAAVSLERQAQAILAAHCYQCHGPDESSRKAKLRLDTREGALASGKILIARAPQSSELFRRITHADAAQRMPPAKAGKPLSGQQIEVLRQWIAAGALWEDSWATRPLRRPPLPTLPESEARWAAHPIDRFVRAAQLAVSLPASPEADRRTLLRRLCYDLTGLPPTPEQADAFILNADPTAYEKLTQTLLASPRYGERWARHWLDVVHYAESHGYDKDKLRPNAWPYRDYVIRAFNEDKPWARFVQEQVAGDVLFPGTRDGMEALGFLSAGPWDFIGHAELPETKIDGKIARHMDRDDMVCNTLVSFNSITIGCAQCHDHKFDPVTQEDYYSLQAVFAAIDRTDKRYDADGAVAAQRARIEARLGALDRRRQQLESALAQRGGKELADLDARIAAQKKPGAPIPPQHGYHSAIEASPDKPKWVQVDLGRTAEVDRVVLLGCHDDFNGIGAGFGFPVRFRIEGGDDADFKSGNLLLADHTGADFPNPGTRAVVFATSGKKCRYIRVTATRLAPRQNDFILALSELQAFDAKGGNLARKGGVRALDSIEAPIRWSRQNLTDGIFPGDASDPAALASLEKQRRELLDRVADPATRAEADALPRERSGLSAALEKLPAPQWVYAGAVHQGSGSFAGTGSLGGAPRAIHLLHRGDVRQPRAEVAPGALSALTHAPSRFALPAGHAEGARRAALAQWLAHPDNPLTWRSIANRVWQHHFGRGLVETPNDFGRMGAAPTHPELLDWLAVELRDGGGSLKHLHRLIVTSATYRQASAVNARGVAVDESNRLLWRQNPRKLEAEALRDGVLLVSGKLDLRMGGPGYRDFVVTHPEHSPHYEYHLHDPDDPASHRRSVYRMVVRSQLQPFMTTLDCADPSIQVGRRNESLSPLQALALLNNGLMLTMSRHFAAKQDAGEGDLPAKVDRAFREALARAPTPKEHDALVDLGRRHGLANVCRVLFNLNEFAFVD